MVELGTTKAKTTSMEQPSLELSKDVSLLHTTILTMCTAKKVNLKLEAKAPLRCRLS
jgi:hypothetical protein